MEEKMYISQEKPIIIERELFFSSQNINQREFFLLNEVNLIFQQDPQLQQDQQNTLQISLQPFLMPEPNLLEIGKQQLRKREPIIFSIEPIPQKINFSFNFDENVDQAFIGDEYQIIIDINPLEDIQLLDMNLVIDKLDFDQLQQQQQTDQLMGTQSISLDSEVTRESIYNQFPPNQYQNFNNVNVLRTQKPANILDDDIIPFTKKKSILKDVEIFYQIYDQASDSFRNKVEFDNHLENNQIQIDKESKKFKLIFKFYQEALNSVHLKFQYKFQVNIDKNDLSNQILTQNYKKSLKIKSQSPFQITFEIKNSNPYIENAKLMNEQLQMASLLAPKDEEFLLVCNITSQSNKKNLYLSKVDLSITDKKKIKILQKIDSNIYIENSEYMKLKSQESCTFLFKLQSIQKEEEDEYYSPQKNNQQIQQYLSTKNIFLNSRLQEVEQFGDLQFQWYSNSENQVVECELQCPNLTFIYVPLKIQELTQKQIQQVKLNEPITIEYLIINNSDQVIDSIIYIEEKDEFYLGGELRTFLSIMPYEQYRFQYTLIPMQIGRIQFPKFNIVEKERNLSLIKSFGRKVHIIK